MDLEQLREWRNTPELRQYFREAREITIEMQEKWFVERANSKNQIDFAIRDISSEKLIGHCSLNYISWINRTAEFGVYLGDSSYRHGGYGVEALRLLFEYGFSDLNLNRIECEVYSNNAALDIYHHLGFKNEGIKRQHYFNAGHYWDSHMLGLLQSEWEAQKSK